MEVEIKASPLEKSKDCIVRYEESTDPWGNRERQLYQRILKKGVQLTYEHVGIKDPITVYDIGCGGGNVLDVWLANTDKEIHLSGCDISAESLKYLDEGYVGTFDWIDLEKYNYGESNFVFTKNIGNADIISIVDVMYYFGEGRDYKDTLDQLWKAIKPGAIVLVADNLVRHFRRDYLTKKPDAELLESFTDHTEKVCEEITDNGKRWNRYLKIRIIKKLEEV